MGFSELMYKQPATAYWADTEYRISAEKYASTDSERVDVDQTDSVSGSENGNTSVEVEESQSESSTSPSAESSLDIRVLLVDDHQMMRDGLKKLIEEEEDMSVIAEADNGEEAVRLAHETSPDIIIMDVNMPVMDGIEATRKITASSLESRIIGLSFHKDMKVSDSMLKAGASTYLTKSDVFETLCATIRREGARTD